MAYGAGPTKMTGPPAQQPVEGRLADRLSPPGDGAGTARMRAVTLLRRLDGYDRAVYRSVAELRLPLLDEPLRLVSDFANFSKPWFLISGFLALFGGSRGRRAALTGLAAIGATSLVVNQPMKMAGARRRPDREVGGVPQQRWVRMPSSTSFPQVTPRPQPPSQLPSETSYRRSGYRWGRRPPSWRSPACIRACTTRVTYSSGRPWAP